jgi:outer membrane protein
MSYSSTTLIVSESPLFDVQQSAFETCHFKKFLNIIILCFMFLLHLEFSPNANAEAVQGIDYQSLSLEDCLALAREYNPVLSGATERIRELVADYQAAKSQFLPRLGLISHYERTNPDRLSSGGGLTTQPLFEEEGLISISGKQILYDGGKTYYNTRAAKIGTEAQRQDVRRTADEVEFYVTEAFYRLIEAKENLKVARETLQQRQEFALVTKAFFKAGKVTQLDSLRAQSQVSEAEQAIVEAENALSLSGEILAALIGFKEETPLNISGRLSEEFAPPADMNSLWQEVLKTNPEIKRLYLESEQRQTQIKAARGTYFPEISLQGGLGVRNHDIGGTKGEWLGGVFIDIPFFEGGLTKAQVAKASSQYLQSLEKKRDRLNSLKVDLTTAWRDQENARQGIVTTRQIMATNEEAYTSAQTLYRYGKAIALDVLQSQVDLARTRFNFIRYAVAYEIARARIKQILGSDKFGVLSAK